MKDKQITWTDVFNNNAQQLNLALVDHPRFAEAKARAESRHLALRGKDIKVLPE